MKRFWLFLLVLLTACTPTLSPPTPTPFSVAATPQVLRLACPDTLQPAVAALATAYQQAEPAITLVVIPREDTLALQALAQGQVDLAALTWLPQQTPEQLWTVPFARDGLAIVVNPQNGVPGLTVAQLRELFQGRAEDWAAWGGLPGAPQVVSREEAAGEFALFQERVMGEARVTLTALLAPNNEAVLDWVGNDSLAVGYLATGRLDSRVRALAVEGVPPAPETLASGLYPLTRDLSLATIGEPEGAARAFIQWVLGPAGQAIVQQAGLVGLP